MKEKFKAIGKWAEPKETHTVEAHYTENGKMKRAKVSFSAPPPAKPRRGWMIFRDNQIYGSILYPKQAYSDLARVVILTHEQHRELTKGGRVSEQEFDERVLAFQVANNISAHFIEQLKERIFRTKWKKK